MSKRLRRSTKIEADRLHKRIDALEKNFIYLDERVGRVIAHFTRQVSELCDVTADICEELTLIQHKLFPNLARDLARVHKIVPFTDARTPEELDRRKTRKSK